MMMLSEQSDNARHSNNIGTLRLVGALMVLFGHCWPLTQGEAALDPLSNVLITTGVLVHPIHELGVCLFFVLSGFLITRSFDRSRSVITYLEARLLRIFPALAATVALTALVLGPALTTLPLKEYFTNADTWTYLGNTASLLHIEYNLPGVFESLPNSAVNGSLWTLKIEFKFYLWVMVFGLLTLLRKRSIFNIAALALLALYISEIAPDRFYKKLVALNVAFLGGYFLAGAFAYVNRDRIPLSPWIAALLAGIAALCHNSAAYTAAFGAMFSYTVLLVAYHPRIRLPVADRHGDFSYGLYLYAFPVQQILIYYFRPESGWWLIAPSLALTTCMAVMSWFLVEKPSMSFKGRLFPTRWRGLRLALPQRRTDENEYR